MTRPTANPAGQGRPGPTATYEIRVAGHLDDHWAATLGDLSLVRLDDGTTMLTGAVVDQAHLHGVLARIRDLGVPLLTLRTLDHAGADSRSSATVSVPFGYLAGGQELDYRGESLGRRTGDGDIGQA